MKKPKKRRVSIMMPGTDSGTVYGKVGAVVLISGERYYMLIDKNGDVALMPASVIEK